MTININYAVEIKTDALVTSTDFGLTADKYFRWVTGRPSYNGVSSFPKWEDDTDNDKVWYEGILLDNSLSNPSRRIDISVSGEYGTLSGINISIANYNKFFSFIQTNDIYLTGRKVRVFLVVDNKFYQIWNGIVQNINYDETSYTLECKDDYKQIHKVLPPNVISVAEISDSSEQGETIPVIIGDVAYSKLVNAGNKPEFINLVETDMLLSYEYDAINHNFKLLVTPSANKKFKQCAVNQFLGYAVNSGYEIGLKTSISIPFAEHALEGYYLVGTKGTGLELDIASKIIHSYESAYGANGEWQTIVRIYGDLGGLYAADIANHEYDTATPDDNWWFGIADLSTIMIAGDASITEFVKDEKNNIYLYKFDNNTKKYYRIDHLIENTSVSDIQGIGYPGIKIMANQMTFDGDISVLSGIIPEQYRAYSPVSINGTPPLVSWRVARADGTFGGWLSWQTLVQSNVLIDKNVNSYLEAKTMITGATSTLHQYPIYLLFPEDKISDDMGDIYLCLDYTVDNPTHAGTVNTYWNVEYLDPYNNSIEVNTDSFVYPSDGSTSAGLPLNCYCLPLDYYKGGTSWTESGYTSTDHFWGRVSGTGTDQVIYSEVMKLSEDVITGIKNGRISDLILIKIFVKFNSAQTCTLKLYQAGFVCRKKISVSDDDIYVRIHNSDIGNTGAIASVYTAYKTILETYDGYGVTGGITGANFIDYSNLPEVRDDWYVGRQITERKNSYDYLNEISKQSFVGMFPTRAGNRKLVAWRDLSTYTASISETGIVRDSITDFEKTDSQNVFNDFKCEYSYNQATKKFDRCLIVTHSDAASFPLSTDTTWKTYVQGLNTNSYADAKVIWDIAHSAYDVTNTLQQNPTDTQKLYWYYDKSIFDNTEFVGASVDDASYKFLQNLVEWTGLRKDKCTFRLPFTVANIQLELLDMVYFEDGFFTDNVQRKGWITLIEVDTKKNNIKLQVTLEPVELIEDDIIIERGIPLNVDVIEESGSQTTQIEES